MSGNIMIVKEEFRLGTLDDELRVDRLCQELLLHFYNMLMEDGMSPEAATGIAGSADYFVRDFVVSIKQRNLFEETPGLVRQFAGNWYIVTTLEPNAGELKRHLEGIRRFYRFLHSRGLISTAYFDVIERECGDHAFYDGRIASFWEIRGDGYFAWGQQCTLKDS